MLCARSQGPPAATMQLGMGGAGGHRPCPSPTRQLGQQEAMFSETNKYLSCESIAPMTWAESRCMSNAGDCAGMLRMLLCRNAEMSFRGEHGVLVRTASTIPVTDLHQRSQGSLPHS